MRRAEVPSKENRQKKKYTRARCGAMLWCVHDEMGAVLNKRNHNQQRCPHALPRPRPLLAFPLFLPSLLASRVPPGTTIKLDRSMASFPSLLILALGFCFVFFYLFFFRPHTTPPLEWWVAHSFIHHWVSSISSSARRTSALASMRRVPSPPTAPRPRLLL